MINATISTAPDQYQVILNNYASIVEKTNSQLGLWTNPYGIMVGILTLMVAVIAIVVAWYIWKNSKEQKELFAEVLVKYQKSLDEQAALFIEKKKLEIDKTIQEFEKLKQSVTEEKKIEFQKVIDEYRKEKEKIYDEPVNVKYDYNDYSQSFLAVNQMLSPIKSTHCTNCGTFFKYKEDSNPYTISLASFGGGARKVYCPKCNTENFI